MDRPTLPDPDQWGPYLRAVYLEHGAGRVLADALHEAGLIFRDQHGQRGRLGRWAREGVDPGPPTCSCASCWS
jgi:hypothetical protein